MAWRDVAVARLSLQEGAVPNPAYRHFLLQGINPLPPEMWLLPYWLLVHPGRFWCHCRMVYLPMSYLYGKRAACPRTPLTEALRTELYVEPYDEICWEAQRNNCGPEDMYATYLYIYLSIYLDRQIDRCR